MLSARHGDAVARIESGLDEHARIDSITARRKSVLDRDHRFFLALLMNVPERQTMLRLLGERYRGEDPEALALRWGRELLAVTAESRDA